MRPGARVLLGLAALVLLAPLPAQADSSTANAETEVTADRAVLVDYIYGGEESGVRYEFLVERSRQERVHRVLMSTFYEGEPKVTNLPVFTEPQDMSGKYVEIADAALLSDGTAAVLIAERHCLYALVADRLCGVLELVQLTGAGSVTGARVIEYKGLVYAAYAALPANHWRHREFVYTQIRYRVRTASGRWTPERILYSTPVPFKYPVQIDWQRDTYVLGLSVQAERLGNNSVAVDLSLNVPEEGPGA